MQTNEICFVFPVGMDKTLRKGNRVFLTSDDGRIQSALYKGQKYSDNTGEMEAILVCIPYVVKKHSNFTFVY